MDPSRHIRAVRIAIGAIVEPENIGKCADPDDDKFLADAIGGEAEITNHQETSVCLMSTDIPELRS
jgi:predicted nucleic acid-binding protein